MKRRLLTLLACPMCGADFTLHETSIDGEDVWEGTLHCLTGHDFPIVRSVPRLVPQMTDGLKEKTADSFGFEWNRFHEMYDRYRINFLNYIDPLKDDFFSGKVVLDAGCGVGRHTYWSAKFGAREVIGIDFSDAVDASYTNTQELPNVHIVQADIYHLPFKKEVFDFIFSIGVLHHLPGPEKGFQSLVPFVKKGGTYAIWVYGKKNNKAARFFYEPLRKITRHIPHQLLYYLCHLPAMGVQIANWLYTILNTYRLTKPLARFVPFKYYSQFPFRMKVNDAFDVFATPKSTYWRKDQIVRWYHDVGIRDAAVTYLRKKGIKAYGTRS